MKLSKEEFLDVIECSRIFCIDNGYDWEREQDISSALENDILEIEGYERFQWIKFDKDNPNTYPPELTRVLVFDKESGDVLTAKYDYDAREWSLSWCMITYWSPLPKPPQEETEGFN